MIIITWWNREIMTTDTLTSLAILKVNIDRGRDYLDYLRPFVLQVLADGQLEEISDSTVTERIEQEFGLVIPPRTVQIVLRRLCKAKHLKREYDVYFPINVPDPGLSQARKQARKKIQETIAGLVEYANQESQLSIDEAQATDAICSFLSKFDVSCLRMYLQETTIPEIADCKEADITLVGKYVLYLQEIDTNLLESFMVVVQGHMLANALLCPDLKSSRNYRGVTFYLDTPLLVQLFGLEGKRKREAIEELLRLLRELDGRISIFSHSREEFGRVLDGAAGKIDAPDGRGGIVFEARLQGTTKSDLLLLATTVDDELLKNGIQLRRTPEYESRFQIDEMEFEHTLEDEVSYFNEQAKAYDINSVRSIYVLRGGECPVSVEKSRAILVTSNTAFAKAAWQYGRKHEASKEVSSVIADFSLANIAWLKAPMGAPSLPMAEVMAFSYAAAQPSSGLISKFLAEIEKLKASGKVTSRQHQLLRSSPTVYDDLMDLTLGDDSALTKESIYETLRRVESEMLSEKEDELSIEKAAHKETQEKLRSLIHQQQKKNAAIYWRCRRVATTASVALVSIISAPVLVSLVMDAGFWVDFVSGKTIYLFGSIVMLVANILSLGFGFTALVMYRRVHRKILRWLLRREEVIDESGQLTLSMSVGQEQGWITAEANEPK